MIKIDENDPIGEVDPSFPYRDVTVRRNTDMKEFYDLQKEIGRGKFGTVYRCTEKSTGLKLAAKFIGISKRQDRRNAEREVEIMRELQHPRLIQMYDAFEINNIMCVVLELIEGGELFERVIDDDFILTEKSVSVFMRQICEGIAFIHSKNILHLDMKPENILCLTRTGNRIKIIDFGLARKYDPEKKLQVLFGTPEFVAPEVVNFDSIGFGTDMWSVGVICYVLLSGLSPFMGETDVQTMANVTIAQYDYDDEAFNEISADAKDFIGKLLLKDREQRMSATECLSHRWLRRRKPVCSVPPNPIPLSELDLQKDTLRNLVDRWNNDTNITLIVNNEDGKGDKVVDICKTNGIIEQQSKSGTVRQSNSIAACDTKDQSATMQPIESVKISENTLLPIESVEAPNILNQVLKPLSDNAFSTSAPSLKRSLSPDMKLENCQKEQNISKSISPSRSGSSSPAVNHKPLLNGDVENMKNQSSQELPKSSHLELPQKSPQKESAGVKKSPSTSPKPTKKKPAKTPSPSINDQQLHQDEPHCKNIDTKQERELISRDGQKSLSTSPKPPKKKLTKTPSPLINDQQPIYHNESVLSGDTSTKQKHLEIVEKSPQRENYDKSAISIQPNKNADVIVNGVLQNIDVDISEAVNKSTTPQKTNETSSENHSNHVVTTAKSVKDISQQKEKQNGEVLDMRSNSVSPVPNKKSAQENNLQKNKSNSRIFDAKSTSISPTPNKQLAQEINTQKASSNSKISDIRSTSVSPAPDEQPLQEIIKQKVNSNNKISDIRSTSVSPAPNAQPVQEISKQKASSNSKISDIRSTSVSPAPNAQPVQEISQNINSNSKLLNIRSTSASPVPSTQSAQEISKQKINSNSKISEIRSTSVSPIPNKQDTTEISKTKNKLSKFLDIRSTSVSPTPSKESPQRIIQQKGKPNEISTTRSSSISPIPNGTPSKEMNQQNNDTKDKLHDIPDTNTTITSQPLRTPIVEISDETYECVKKRRFTIKSVESKTTTIDSGDSMRVKSVEKTSTETSTTQPANRRSIFTPEVSPKVLRKLNDFMSTSELMKRRISDISNLLSRTEQDMDHSISEEMSSLCNKLNRIVRLRHDSYSMDGSSNIKRPKFRISYFSRDVPLASTPPLHADLLNYLPLNDETISTPVWSFQKTNPFHSDPSSLRNSPERFASPSLTKKLLSKFFKDSLDYDISSTPSTSNGLPKDKITGIIS